MCAQHKRVHEQTVCSACQNPPDCMLLFLMKTKLFIYCNFISIPTASLLLLNEKAACSDCRLLGYPCRGHKFRCLSWEILLCVPSLSLLQSYTNHFSWELIVLRWKGRFNPLLKGAWDSTRSFWNVNHGRSSWCHRNGFFHSKGLRRSCLEPGSLFEVAWMAP